MDIPVYDNRERSHAMGTRGADYSVVLAPRSYLRASFSVSILSKLTLFCSHK